MAGRAALLRTLAFRRGRGRVSRRLGSGGVIGREITMALRATHAWFAPRRSIAIRCHRVILFELGEVAVRTHRIPVHSPAEPVAPFARLALLIPKNVEPFFFCPIE